MRILINEVDPAVPTGAQTDHQLDELDDETLARLYAYPDGRWLRANMVSTLDGAATGADGKTGSINNAVDKRVFAFLRTLADVVVVGAGTARAEGYGRPWPVKEERAWLREGRSPAPALVVVSRTANLPLQLTSPPEVEGAGAVLLATCEAADDKAVEAARSALGTEQVLVLGEDAVDLAAVLDQLAARGLRRMLTEGGPHLLRDLAAAGVLDELCLTVVPHMLAGEHPRILDGEGVDLALSPRLLLEADGTLLGRWS